MFGYFKIIYKNRFSSTVMIYLDFRLRFWTIDYRLREIQFGQKEGIFPYLPIFGPLILARISLPKIQFGHGLSYQLSIAICVHFIYASHNVNE